MSELPPLSSLASELLAKERARGPEDSALKQRALARAREVLNEDRPSGVALRPADHLAWQAARRRAPRAVLVAAATVAVAGLAAAGAGLYSWQAEGSGVRSLEVHRSGVAPGVVAPRLMAPRAVVPSAEEVKLQASEPPVTEAPSRAPRERGASAAATENTQASPSVQTYALEAGLLEPARRQIGSGNYAGAMTAIARHQREYPRGQLAEEREALRVRALWGMGQRSAAESAAAAFRKRYPRSVLLSWMKGQAKPGP